MTLSTRDRKDRPMKRWIALAALAAAAPIGPAAAALAFGISLTALSAPGQAQTAEQLEQQYGREAMAQALDVKRRYDLYGVHFETGQATIQPLVSVFIDRPFATRARLLVFQAISRCASAGTVSSACRTTGSAPARSKLLPGTKPNSANCARIGSSVRCGGCSFRTSAAWVCTATTT